jgi:hypothetical protein
MPALPHRNKWQISGTVRSTTKPATPLHPLFSHHSQRFPLRRRNYEEVPVGKVITARFAEPHDSLLQWLMRQTIRHEVKIIHW